MSLPGNNVLAGGYLGLGGGHTGLSGLHLGIHLDGVLNGGSIQYSCGRGEKGLISSLAFSEPSNYFFLKRSMFKTIF